MKSLISLMLLVLPSAIFSQTPNMDKARTDWEIKEEHKPVVHGTVRGRFEVQPDAEEACRSEVRNARVSLEGSLPNLFAYKAEVDLSDEGTIKALDVYGRLNPYKSLNITVGQFRVPFTIDAHRGPHKQYFANRSFVAKQVGNVRDVGFMFGYTWNAPFKIVFDAAVFNGTRIGEPQKKAWHNDFNYSARLQTFPLKNVNVTASIQRSRCDTLSWAHYTSYDLGAYYENKHLHIEGEILRKHYEDNVYDDVNAINVMGIYSHKLNKCYFQNISYLLRYDYMDDYADGKVYLPNKEGLSLSHHERHRVTAGVTLHLKSSKTVYSELRLNYEDYFYKDGVTPKVAEQDKFVAELMVRF
jgi:hypothetical protein